MNYRKIFNKTVHDFVYNFKLVDNGYTFYMPYRVYNKEIINEIPQYVISAKEVDILKDMEIELKRIISTESDFTVFEIAYTISKSIFVDSKFKFSLKFLQNKLISNPDLELIKKSFMFMFEAVMRKYSFVQSKSGNNYFCINAFEVTNMNRRELLFTMKDLSGMIISDIRKINNNYTITHTPGSFIAFIPILEKQLSFNTEFNEVNQEKTSSGDFEKEILEAKIEELKIKNKILKDKVLKYKVKNILDKS